MAISNFTMPHPDFINDEIINPDEFDANSAAISSKLSEIITTLNSLGLSVVPYTGATTSVDLGDYSLRAGGLGLKDGNSDGIYYQFNEDTDGRLALKSRFTADGAYRTNLMYFTADGLFSTPFQTYVRASNNSSQSIGGTIGSPTRITTFSTPSIDRQSEWSSNRFTAKSAGIFNVRMWFTVGSAPTGHLLGRVYKNGSNNAVVAAGTAQKELQGNYQIDLQTGDYLDFYLDMDNGGTSKTLNSSSIVVTITKIS